MPFPKDADSLRAKLHLTDAGKPAIIGAALAAIVVIVLVVQAIAGMMSADAFEVVKAETKAEEAGESQDSGVGATEEPVEPATIYVHVAGAVLAPGLYQVPEGSRVQDAVDAAGGLSEGASPSSINLARVLADGEQLVVPTLEEAAAQAASAATAAGGSTAAPFASSGKVNINTADAAALDTLPGIGASTAQKIVADREANGPFSTIEDLQRVSGIGAKKYAQLADLISVG